MQSFVVESSGAQSFIVELLSRPGFCDVVGPKELGLGFCHERLLLHDRLALIDTMMNNGSYQDNANGELRGGTCDVL